MRRVLAAIRRRWLVPLDGGGQSSGSANAERDSEHLIARLAPRVAAIADSQVRGAMDPIFVLVDLTDARWLAVLGLLLAKFEGFYFSPEAAIGVTPEWSGGSDGPYYEVPRANGTKLTSGIYVVEREDLALALCEIRGVPVPFIRMLKQRPPRGKRTGVCLDARSMGIRHVDEEGRAVGGPSPL